ncbi:putative RNA-editing complex protein MP100 [Leptomonas seymouri]|uniref:Putative RNA-editing complex protein MP100 n=1 Tax=Leptomonas seymouri TaxID=5684 RepID=A0A0N1HU57_LEPSE|nr:putative RNA-editing complex protein MP100 [Leptomonas seymouri]|eukprot:KPI83645.1 putative RNA-editing complex protein MP100 [Leptomonas seymouri]
MRGLLRTSPRCLASSYRDGKRLIDVYQLLITKKPVEYDYVAIDVNSFFGGAQRLAKNVSTEQRKNREISRHVLNTIQQLLRRIVCRHSLFLALDGAGTAATVHNFRHSKTTRRIEMRQQRLPGMAMARAVEERIVKAMPLARSLIPREVVVSGTSVEGCVERKVAAWALDLACRDGTQEHTTRSLCVIGAGTLWHTMLGLNLYFHGTHVVHGSTDLRHLTLSDTLTWLELSAHVQSGDTHAVMSGRTDALLLMLLCNGCEVTHLPALPGANFVVLMDAYHCQRRMSGSAGKAAAAGAAATYSSSEAPSTSSSFQLLRELPNNTLEIDLLALYVLFIPESEVATAVADLTNNASGPPFSRSSSHAASPVDGAPGKPNSSAHQLLFDSFLAHVLSTHYLLSYGETTVDATQVPFYMSTATASTKDSVPGEGEAVASGSTASKATPVSVKRNRMEECTLSAREWARYLEASVRRGQRYRVVSNTPLAKPPLSSPVATKMKKAAAGEAAGDSQPTAGPEVASTAVTPTSQPSYCPFWSASQPWTSAEYTLLCQTLATQVEQLLREYLPGIAHKVQPEFVRNLISPKFDVDEARSVVQRLLAHANAGEPHPSLCFSPSYCWTHNEKSRLWNMRYVDLGTQARRMDIRHVRSLLSGMSMTQQQSEEGATIFDAVARTWVLQPTFPLPSPRTVHASDCTVAEEEEEKGPICRLATPPAGVAPTLKLLTWNVMFDRYSNQPTPLGMPGIDWCSPKRYPVLAKLIAEEDADVVGMQEVELAFAEYLAAQPWCRERYIMSCRPRSSILDPWGVLLLVRRGEDAWPVQQLLHLNVPAWPGHVSLMPVATLDLSSKNGQCDSARLLASSADRAAHRVNVCSVHLLAPYLKTHETARTGQDQALRHCLTRQLHGDTIVMGDFNDWPSNEFSMPTETRYVECWPIVHPGDYGKTMDESNTFCKLKIEEIFFGRSDKLFLRTGGGPSSAPPLLKPVEAHLVGTRSVNAENGNQDSPAYLFPSDHYGVSMTFQVLRRGAPA